MPIKVNPTQFRLDNIEHNRAFVAKKLKQVQEIIEETKHYKILRTGDGYNGWIFLYNISEQTADYVIQYEAKQWSWTSKTITQCILWRDQASLYVRDATTRMFFNYLLKNYPAIMSDTHQTENGHDFWIRRMVDAINKGYKVGLAKLYKHQIDWFNPSDNFKNWLKTQDAFGDSVQNQTLRYVISNP